MQGGDIGKEYRGVDHKSHCNCRFKYFDVINQVMQNMFVCENLRFTAALYNFEIKTCRISAQRHHGFMFQNESRQASGPIDWTFVYLNKLPEATEDYPWPASSTA